MDSPPSAILDPNKSSSPSPSDLASEVVDDGYISTAPMLLFDREFLDKKYYAFCLLDSTLYMFQKGFAFPGEGRKAYSYNLYSHLFDVNSKTVVRYPRPLPDMLGYKLSTEAIATPDATRILVFPTSLRYNSFMPSDPFDFELYYPAKTKRLRNPWKRLPSLQAFLRLTCEGLRSMGFVVIESFTFITNSIFLIQTSKIGMFTLNIDDPSVGWQKLHTFHGSSHVPFHSRFFVIEEHKLCIVGKKAYDISNESKCVFNSIKSFDFPRSPFANEFKHIDRLWFANHIVYGEGGELFGSACLQMGISTCERYAHVRLDVYKFNLDKYRDDKQQNIEGADVQLETSTVKTFKFLLDGYECFDFYPLLFSPILTYSRRHRMKKLQCL